MIRPRRFPARSLVITLAVVAGSLAPAALGAEEPARLDTRTLTNGPSPFPLIWKPYRPAPLPLADFGNGSRLAGLIAGGTLSLSPSRTARDIGCNRPAPFPQRG